MSLAMLRLNPKPQRRFSIKGRKKLRAHMSKQGVPSPQIPFRHKATLMWGEAAVVTADALIPHNIHVNNL
jgi:hypothetical protein